MHTPGPWQFYRLPGDDGLGYIRPDPEDGHEIAHHGDMDRSREENIANANLIAAAPDLLEALIDLLPYFQGEHHPDHPQVVAARAAIAKAEERP